MSWHHGDYIDLISAAGTLAAAFIAAYAASQSNKSARESRLLQEESRIHQKELHDFEREKHLYELLRADAERANDNARQGYPSELSFSQASNVAHSLASAKSRILEVSTDDKKLTSKYIRYFRDQLTEEVNAYMCDMVPASIDAKEPTMEQIEASSLWTASRRFFEFRYCDDEDLSDEED
ncbi:hypothetical protein [Pantoea ananatis]|uniref:hypothetical protein n=1 Tax=Pantoea ananas TaxID=553 RepID=UPI0002323153|nr:hypothetical protein [Pantoea ananatis]AER32320.1 hypothetical protein PAGR_g1804 [Pantoea ananatis PA13]